MSAERLCEAYGEHQPYCSLHGYPIDKSVGDLIAEARAAAVAPVLEALREAWWGTAECPPELSRRNAALLSAPPRRPSGEPEPGGLDVERLARALEVHREASRRRGDLDGDDPLGHCDAYVFDDEPNCHDEIAAEYARLTPERPAGEAGT